jgi:DNA polymerase I-like protein with 3'-5' exonuclease and polymerase domains
VKNWLQNLVSMGMGQLVCRYAEEKARRMGCVLLPSGRHRPLPGFASKNPGERGEAERKAVNTVGLYTFNPVDP